MSMRRTESESLQLKFFHKSPLSASQLRQACVTRTESPFKKDLVEREASCDEPTSPTMQRGR
jgi:hypothetical protein